jgi:hypothetical protein
MTFIILDVAHYLGCPPPLPQMHCKNQICLQYQVYSPLEITPKFISDDTNKPIYQQAVLVHVYTDTQNIPRRWTMLEITVTLTVTLQEHTFIYLCDAPLTKFTAV